MFTCKICGRKFKSIKALGGHTSSAHPAKPTEPTEGENGNPEPVEAETEDESVAAEIREYLSRGYSFEQLTKQLHFKERTVRQEMAKMVVPASEQDTNLPATYKQTEAALEVKLEYLPRNLYRPRPKNRLRFSVPSIPLIILN